MIGEIDETSDCWLSNSHCCPIGFCHRSSRTCTDRQPGSCRYSSRVTCADNGHCGRPSTDLEIETQYHESLAKPARLRGCRVRFPLVFQAGQREPLDPLP